MEYREVKKSTDRYGTCNFCQNEGNLIQIGGRSLIVTICPECIIELMKWLPPVSPSEDKTAEEILLKHINHKHLTSFKGIDIIEVRPELVIKAMTEYGSLRWNKAIEEALRKVSIAGAAGDKSMDDLISELNKLKHP